MRARARCRRWIRGNVGFCVVVLPTLALGADAGASRAPVARASSSPPTLAAADEEEEDGHRLRWTFPRFRSWEAVVGGLTTGGSVMVETMTDDFRNSSWNDGILFDGPARQLLVAHSFSGRERAAAISDVMWPITQYLPVVDSLFTPLVTDGFNVDVAVQQTLINWQVITTTHLLVRLLQHVAGRARPSLSECSEDPYYAGACSPSSVGRTASFVSGHTAMSFASAMLTCSHHGALPMYGGTFADGAMCALMITSASTVGVLRIVADRHWPSDVLAGAALGIATGYGLPQLLHYTHDSSAPDATAAGVRHWAVMPMASDRLLGVAVMGAL